MGICAKHWYFVVARSLWMAIGVCMDEDGTGRNRRTYDGDNLGLHNGRQGDKAKEQRNIALDRWKTENG